MRRKSLTFLYLVTFSLLHVFLLSFPPASSSFFFFFFPFSFFSSTFSLFSPSSSSSSFFSPSFDFFVFGFDDVVIIEEPPPSVPTPPPDRCAGYQASDNLTQGNWVCQALSPCMNGGLCLPTSKCDSFFFQCECPPGFSGLYCQIVTTRIVGVSEIGLGRNEEERVIIESQSNVDAIQQIKSIISPSISSTLHLDPTHLNSASSFYSTSPDVLSIRNPVHFHADVEVNGKVSIFDGASEEKVVIDLGERLRELEKRLQVLEEDQGVIYVLPLSPPGQ